MGKVSNFAYPALRPRLALVVELGQRGGELAAARSRPRDDDDGPGRDDVGVGAVPLFADDRLHVGGVALRELVGVDRDAPALELVPELHRRGLVLEAGDDHRADVEPPLPQVVDELEGVGVVGDTEVGAHLLAFDVPGVNAQDDVDLVLQLLEEAHLDVGIVARQDPRRVVVVEELAAELQEELVAELPDALEDRGGLLRKVLLVVEPDPVPHPSRPPGPSMTL